MTQTLFNFFPFGNVAGHTEHRNHLTKGITQSRGHVDQALVEAFFAAGWTKENLVDAIVIIGDKTVSNYLHSTTKIPVDFPAAPNLD